MLGQLLAPVDAVEAICTVGLLAVLTEYRYAVYAFVTALDGIGGG
jgi:hypothetical protein